MRQAFKYYTYATHFRKELFKSIENQQLDLDERKSAVEALALLPIDEARKHICVCLEDGNPAIRTSAILAAINHVDFDIFRILMKISEDEEELSEVKEACRQTLAAWRDNSLVTLEHFRRLRERSNAGTNKVELIELCGDDLGHALSAWTSTSRELTDEKRARVPQMLKSLAEQNHHSVFEKSYIRFLVTCDLASHVHFLKHRIGVSINGESARYKELKDDKFYVPLDFKDEEELTLYIEHMEISLKKYHDTLARLVSKGVPRKRAKDLARFYIPYGNQTVMDISFNFRSFMHFQGLRNSEHAQVEICTLAKNMLKLVYETGKFEESCKAFGWTKEKIYE